MPFWASSSAIIIFHRVQQNEREAFLQMFKLIHKDLKLKLLRTTPSAGSLVGSCSASCRLCSGWREIAGAPDNKPWPGTEHLHNKGHGDFVLARWLATKRRAGAYGSAESLQTIQHIDCKGIKAQGLLGSGSLLLSTQLKLVLCLHQTKLF